MIGQMKVVLAVSAFPVCRPRRNMASLDLYTESIPAESHHTWIFVVDKVRRRGQLVASLLQLRFVLGQRAEV
jgi:hypothetical protein